MRPEVLADQAEREQLDAADQQHDEQQRRHAALVDARVAGDDRERQAEQRGERAGEAGERRELEREVRERGHAVEREAQHAPDRELRLAGAAGGAVVLDDVAPEADPRAHPAQEARALAHAQQRVERRAVEEAEVAGVGLELDLGEPAHERVEPARGGELEARLALALAALGDHDVGALAPALDQLGDQLRRVLEVAVDHHHRVPARVVEAGGERHLVAERAREVEHADARVVRRRAGRGSRAWRPTSRRRRPRSRTGGPRARLPARVQNSAASPSSLSIGATTLSRRSSRADIAAGV